MLEALENLPKARTIVYAALGIPYLVALTALIHAVRWW
jgi:hypothetical protein